MLKKNIKTPEHPTPPLSQGFKARSFPLPSKQHKMRMLGFYLLFPLLTLMGLTVSGQEAFELIHLNPSIPPSIAISVTKKDLPLVSSSVLVAEGWLKSHVLTHFPSTKITTIVVGRGVLCNKNHVDQWDLVLPSVKNLYYSLVRWGLLREIKVSAAFSYDCFEVQNTLKPLLRFLQDSSLPYTVDHFPLSSPSALKSNLVAYTHLKSLKMLGFSRIRDVRMIEGAKPISGKLSSLNLPSISYHENQDFIKRLGFSTLRDIGLINESKPMKRKLSSLNFPLAPSHQEFLKRLDLSTLRAIRMMKESKHKNNLLPSLKRSRNPSPPSPEFAPVPGSLFPFAPNPSPTEIPVSPPEPTVEPPMPRCLPAAASPAPGTGEGEKEGLWCVAKPTVPAETLQEAMDYACGEGGADCEEIRPNGNCFNPDNLVAHASYAFNSYWQKTKQSGGSCNFDGTAILINSDPKPIDPVEETVEVEPIENSTVSTILNGKLEGFRRCRFEVTS